MATPKSQKDKLHGVAPRFLPRPTAASAARAAKNATTRNQTALATLRQSPVRSPPSPATSKMRTAVSRNGQKTESKTEIKINRNCESEILHANIEEPLKQGTRTEADLFFAAYEDGIIKQEEHVVFSSTDDLQDVDSYVSDMQIVDNNILVPVQIATAGIVQPESLDSQSRPQTPRNVSSRPETPKLPSRPTTPAYPAQRYGTPTSRPNTPQRNTPPKRPKTPSMHNSLLPRPITPVSSNRSRPPSPTKEGDDLKSLYISKKKEYHQMKMELDFKQQAILEVFNGLRALQDRMAREGIAGGGECRQDLVVFNVADWAPEEVAQLCRDAVASPETNGALELFQTSVPIDDCALSDVESKTLNIPGCFADLCLQAFTARQELIDWVKELIQNQQEFGCNDAVDRIAHYNKQGLELCEALREMKSRADDALDTVTLFSKRACRERSTLIAVGESLVREIARLRQEIESRSSVILKETRAEDDVTKAYEEMRRELEEERTAKTALKDKLTTAESQLRQTRLRVSKMDKQMREAEASIASLTGTVKTLEDQSRQREVLLEARARKLKESLKTGEVATGHLAQKRDALQAEVNELKEQIQTMTTQHKAEVEDLDSKLKELMTALQEQKNVALCVTEQKQEIEMALAESQNVIEELKTQVTKLENSQPNPDLPTQREMDLWAELHATKEILRNTEDEVVATKKEKVRFLETLSKITDSENKGGMQQKLACELINKEEIVAKMQTQIRELTKNIKLNEKKVFQYEQYVRDLHSHNRSVSNCQEASNGISFQDLEQEILSLRMNLLDAVHRNEDLSEALSQKEQMLEQQDKTSRAQVREELINMLKNKETEQSRELSSLQQDLEHRMKIVDEVNKQIAAKADEIQELFSTLENKQQQIHRLEKIVLALEEQQRRAQAQRMRHEEKIAALEHELAAGGNRRERKFIFF
ncbi:myosin heavy chain, muscle-like isoform X3 [Pararge aegeria]|uniref:myosin heavy chain, muscle-like isoform X3 n=1 Tax=Pararge aegeria TaxID=116150 RepID=UPI0019D02C83|nr:myosin heavy chain, muscle-like isoform X3 [Pararge aegeria]